MEVIMDILRDGVCGGGCLGGNWESGNHLEN